MGFARGDVTSMSSNFQKGVIAIKLLHPVVRIVRAHSGEDVARA